MTTRRRGSSPHTRGARLQHLFHQFPDRIIPAYAGSTPTDYSTASKTNGSSPHTRGAHDPENTWWLWSGIIPAYAGSTVSGRSGGCGAWDHPRIRGEHGTAKKNSPNSNGSSPHTRGAHVHVRLRNDIARIIPAYAGSTRASAASFCHEADHPRIRGEHCPRGAGPVGVDGSSPHTRGAPSSSHTFVPHSGIIPAYAGSTSCAWGVSHFLADHPRIRGEHARVDELVAETLGSSPHTRGARSISTSLKREIADLPRIRGEHQMTSAGRSVSSGSSPHTRGARSAPGNAEAQSRIIPAYAGSTVTVYSFVASAKDHPRIRGEHLQGGKVVSLGPGSSPHTRGARPRDGSKGSSCRIIPAYAGSTHRGASICTSASGSSPHTRGAPACAISAPRPRRIIPAYAGSTPP